MISIAKLHNRVQNYSWGSRTAIAALLGDSVPSAQPQAELWMGTHPNGSSTVEWNGHKDPLEQWIRANPELVLGAPVAKRFGNQLPFLFKILAAEQPLSIQAHPNLTQARNGYARENHRQISLQAPHRNYRDANHKPEILCALTEFCALAGFRPWPDMVNILRQLPSPALTALARRFVDQPSQETFVQFFRQLLQLDGARRKEIVDDVANYARSSHAATDIYQWIADMKSFFPGDIGIVCALLLNPVRLRPGEAIFLPAGQLHTYVCGVGVELMANSDNVLRGGLTQKHIDVDELLRIVDFRPREPHTIRPCGKDAGEAVFATPAEEFQLSALTVKKAIPYRHHRPHAIEILICVEGHGTCFDRTSGDVLDCQRGTSIVVPAAVDDYELAGAMRWYKATVP